MIVAFLLSLLLAGDEPIPIVVPPPPVISPPSIRPIYPAPPFVSHASKAKGNVAALFSVDDYPTSAIRNGEEGVVQADLLIGADGRVTDCSIIRSSGSLVLDQATCSIIRRRARFIPARDGAGRPVSDHYMVRIRWELPDEAAFSDWIERDIVNFDAKGKASGCRYQMGDRDEDLSECGDQLERAQSLVSGHPDLGKRSLSIVFEEQFEANPTARPRSIGSQPGEQLISLQLAEFDIDPAGSVAHCRVTLRRGVIAEGVLCEELLYERYDSLPTSVPQATRRGRRMTAVYLKR